VSLRGGPPAKADALASAGRHDEAISYNKRSPRHFIPRDDTNFKVSLFKGES